MLESICMFDSVCMSPSDVWNEMLKKFLVRLINDFCKETRLWFKIISFSSFLCFLERSSYA